MAEWAWNNLKINNIAPYFEILNNFATVLVFEKSNSEQNGVVAHAEKLKNYRSILRDFKQFFNGFSFRQF